MGNYYNGGPKIVLAENGGKIWILLQPGTAGF
jgi:hypothetical protein